MTKLFILAAALTVWAMPAQATSSAACRSLISPAVRLELTIGHLVGPVIAQARLTDGNRTVEASRGGTGAVIGQSFVDDHFLHLDLVDETGSSFLAQLRTWRRSGRGEYGGTMRVGSRTYQVRCRIDA